MSNTSLPPTMVEVVRRLQADASDEDAWRVFVVLFSPTMRRITRSVFSGDDDAASDAMQEFLMQVFLRKPFLHVDAVSFEAYASRMLRNVAVDVLRRRSRQRQTARDPYAMEGIESLSAHPSRGESEDQIFAQLVLEELSAELDHESQRLLVMIMEGYELRRIAETLGVSSTAVGVRIWRLRQRLAKYK